MLVPEAAAVVVGAVGESYGASRGIGGAQGPSRWTLGVPRVLLFPAVGKPGGGGLIFFCGGQAAQPTPDGVLASCLEVIEPLAPVTPYRLTLIRAQGICIPAAEIYLGRRPPHAHK